MDTLDPPLLNRCVLNKNSKMSSNFFSQIRCLLNHIISVLTAKLVAVNIMEAWYVIHPSQYLFTSNITLINQNLMNHLL